MWVDHMWFVMCQDGISGTGKGELSDNYAKSSKIFKQRHGKLYVKTINKGIHYETFKNSPIND